MLRDCCCIEDDEEEEEEEAQLWFKVLRIQLIAVFTLSGCFALGFVVRSGCRQRALLLVFD